MLPSRGIFGKLAKRLLKLAAKEVTLFSSELHAFCKLLPESMQALYSTYSGSTSFGEPHVVMKILERLGTSDEGYVYKSKHKLYDKV